MIFQAVLVCMGLALAALTLICRRAKSSRSINPQICIILGSGGHTTEMCEILRHFNFHKCHKVTVITGTSDHLSESFFTNYFQPLRNPNSPKFQFMKAKRTNQVKQSKVTSIATTLLATLDVFVIIIKNLLGTNHLISNGPGICVPFFYLFWLLNKLTLTKAKLIFVESWCRVSTISVAGKIVSRVADEFLVHWQNQDQMVRGAEYKGRII